MDGVLVGSTPYTPVNVDGLSCASNTGQPIAPCCNPSRCMWLPPGLELSLALPFFSAPVVCAEDVARVALAGGAGAVGLLAGRLVLLDGHLGVAKPHQLHRTALLDENGGLLLGTWGALGLVVAAELFSSVGNHCRVMLIGPLIVA